MGVENPWPGLAEQARGGTLRMQDGAALTAAQYAADVAAALLSVGLSVNTKSFYDMAIVHDRGAPPGSAEALASKFRKAARDFFRVLGAHRQLMQTMVETFVEADKAFARTEATAADEFLALAKKSRVQFAESVPGVFNTKIPDRFSGSTPKFDDDWARKWTGGQNGLPAQSSSKDTSPVGVESPNPSGQWLLQVKNNLQWGDAAIAGDLWKWAGEQIQPAAQQLKTKLTTMQNDGVWQGESIRGGIDAATRYYHDQATKLVEGTALMALNLDYIASWLPSFYDGIPWDTGTETASTKAAQTAFNNTYIPGLQSSNSAIPILDVPAASGPVPPIVPPGPAGTGSTAPSASPGGPGPGPGTPAAPPGQQVPSDPPPSENVPGQPKSPDTSALQQAAQQAAQQAQNAAQQAAQGLQQAQGGPKNAAPDAPQGVPGGPGPGTTPSSPAATPAGLPQPPSAPSAANLPGVQPTAAANAARSPGGPGPGSTRAGGLEGAPRREPTQASKLFPRAAAGPASAVSRAGLASGLAGSPAGGMPMAPGAAGAGGQGQNKEYKRPDYLGSEKNVDEIFQDAPLAVRPVIDMEEDDD